MNEDLRAMTLSMAIEYSKSQEPAGMTAEEVIVAAKKFEQHIRFGGLA